MTALAESSSWASGFISRDLFIDDMRSLLRLCFRFGSPGRHSLGSKRSSSSDDSLLDELMRLLGVPTLVSSARTFVDAPGSDRRTCFLPPVSPASRFFDDARLASSGLSSSFGGGFVGTRPWAMAWAWTSWSSDGRSAGSAARRRSGARALKRRKAVSRLRILSTRPRTT